MDNFIFALNSTMPLFLVILLGYFLQRTGMLNDVFNNTANDYVFKCALPVSLFRSIANMDFYGGFNLTFCLFCFLGTTVMFLGTWAIAALTMKERRWVGAFSQAAVRSSGAILGLALATNIYGDTGMVPMMIMSAVPFFNVYSVLILSFSPQVDGQGNLLPAVWGGAAVRKACLDVLRNPLIIGVLLGVPFALLRWQVPAMLDSALNMVGGTASPVALLVVGASFSGAEALTRWKPAAAAAFVKLLLLPAVFLPLAALMGFRGSEMVAVLIMAGSPTTVSAFVMAKKMHGDAVLTSNAVVISTVFSAFSITLWLFFLRSFALI